MDRADEEALLAAAKAGDQDAFGRLVDGERQSLYRLCFKMAGSHEDAEDLVQEALLRAFSALGTFREQSSFKTWLHRIATNLCLDHQRRRPPWREERRWQWFGEHREAVLQIQQHIYM